LARTMNIPSSKRSNDKSVPVNDKPVTNERRIVADVETQKKIFDNIKSSIHDYNLVYADASDDKISEWISSITNSNSTKFDTLIGTLEKYGRSMKQCDEIMGQIDDRDEPEFFNEVNQFVIKIEKNYNAIMNYFSRLPLKSKLDFLNIDKDLVKVDEINNAISRITHIEYFSEKQKDLLIHDLIVLIEKMQKDYDAIKQKSFFSVFVTAAIVSTIVFFAITFIGGLLGGILIVPLYLGYIYLVFKKYGQLKSIAESYGESGSLKLFLIAVTLNNND